MNDSPHWQGGQSHQVLHLVAQLGSTSAGTRLPCTNARAHTCCNLAGMKTLINPDCSRPLQQHCSSCDHVCKEGAGCQLRMLMLSPLDSTIARQVVNGSVQVSRDLSSPSPDYRHTVFTPARQAMEESRPDQSRPSAGECRKVPCKRTVLTALLTHQQRLSSDLVLHQRVARRRPAKSPLEGTTCKGVWPGKCC